MLVFGGVIINPIYTMKIPILPGKYHQNGGFSMAMLVYRSVDCIFTHLVYPGASSATRLQITPNIARKKIGQINPWKKIPPKNGSHLKIPEKRRCFQK